jgi:hypothetical protein
MGYVSGLPRCGLFAVNARFRRVCTFLILAAGSLVFTGCQVQEVSSAQLQIHQERLDRDGLTPVQMREDLHITFAEPKGWDCLPLNTNLLYTHQQWRSADRHVGFGIAYIHTPLPLPAEAIVWLAKNQYSKGSNRDEHGKLLDEWTDTLGRRWFEAENDLYHIRGYAMTHGNSAWVVYSGFRVRARPEPEEVAVGERAAESIAPMLADSH